MALFQSVLLTACSEPISQGLCRILRMTGAAERVIGCDTHDYHPGELLFDSCDVISPAEDPAFLNSPRASLNATAPIWSSRFWSGDRAFRQGEPSPRVRIGAGPAR